MRRSGSALAAALMVDALGCADTPVEPSDLMAQSAPQGTAGAGGGLLEHAAELGLTATQVAEIERIQDELRATNAPLLEQLRPADGTRPDREAARELMGQLRENTRAAHEQVLALLTDAQREQLSALRPARGGPGRGGFGPRGFGAPGMMLLRLREQLELTDAQVAQLRAIAEELRAQNEPLFARLRERGERPQRDDPLLQQIRENARAASERTLAVLTDAQRAELETLRERRGEGDGTRGGLREWRPRWGGAAGR
jgi:hypothetical protein